MPAPAVTDRTSATVKHSFREMPLGPEMQRHCVRSKVSLSHLLEKEDPTERYPTNDPLSGLDAFERQLLRWNIRTKSDPRTLRPASTIYEFVDPVMPDGRSFAEDVDEGKRFFASNQPQSWILYPEFINRQIRITPLPEDVLNELVAMITPTDTNLYKTIYLTDGITAQAGRRLWRVGEGAEIPLSAILGTSENGISLSKYGLTLRGSYEVYRRLRLDLFTIMLARVAMQIKLDLATQACNVLVNGDGNSNAAPNFNVSALDSTAGAGPGVVTDMVTGATSSITRQLTYTSWLKFRASLYPLSLTTVVGRLNEIIQVLTLQMPNIDPLMLLALLQQPDQRAQTGTLTLAVNVFGSNVRLVYHPFAPGGMLIGLDKRFALEQLVEQNSAITETDKDIRSQLNEIVVSQVTGFGKILTLASSTLTFA